MDSCSLSNITDAGDSVSFKEVIHKPPEFSETSSFNIASTIINRYALNYPKGQQEVLADKDKDIPPNDTQLKVKKQEMSCIEAMNEYLSRRRISDLLQFMMAQIIANEPDDPVAYLQQLMDKCLMFRSGVLCEPPLLFEDRHLASLYSSMDPLNTGNITTKQYHVGMHTIGLQDNQYEMKPEIQADGNVTRQTFLTNAKMSLVEQLMDMVMLPPPYEDGDTSSLETFYH